MIGPGRFREAMGCFATGVAVVTGRAPSGDYVGLTANSLTSVSLEPPLVLVCLDRSSESRSVLLESRRFAISVLGSDQEELARRFAGEARDTRFEDLAVRFGIEGVPILDGALAWLDCRIWEVVEAGDHTVLFGQVEDGGTGRYGGSGEPGSVGGAGPEGRDGGERSQGSKGPLVFYRGGYGTVAP
jgi:flavin reductase (DIM6/NTAB) family NADH-FMN oxidoreductase RutF